MRGFTKTFFLLFLLFLLLLLLLLLSYTLTNARSL
jgi:hypothetical protein